MSHCSKCSFPSVKCPVLEDLTIRADRFYWDMEAIRTRTLNIPAAGLKMFKILGDLTSRNEYSFSTGAQKLENIFVSGEAGLSNYNFTNNAKAMVKVVIHLTHAYREKENCLG